MTGARGSLATPPAAQLILDFVNTVEWQVDEDAWGSPAALSSWAQRRLAQAPRTLTAGDLAWARRIREGLRELLLMNAGHEPLPDAVADVNAALESVPLSLSFGSDGRPALVLVATERRSFLGPVIAAVDAVRSDGSWSRLKACSRDSCRWAYWDGSRNRSGRWCSMEGCGNYVKMRRRNGVDGADGDALPPTGRAPRMLDVAARAGVSIKTVSNVVTGGVPVSAPTRARVEAAIAELGYVPNLAARALRTGRGSSGRLGSRGAPEQSG
jgi:predicted RNA-binding Zn ribbon-like protein